MMHVHAHFELCFLVQANQLVMTCVKARQALNLSRVLDAELPGAFWWQRMVRMYTQRQMYTQSPTHSHTHPYIYTHTHTHIKTHANIQSYACTCASHRCRMSSRRFAILLNISSFIAGRCYRNNISFKSGLNYTCGVLRSFNFVSNVLRLQNVEEYVEWCLVASCGSAVGCDIQSKFLTHPPNPGDISLSGSIVFLVGVDGRERRMVFTALICLALLAVGQTGLQSCRTEHACTKLSQLLKEGAQEQERRGRDGHFRPYTFYKSVAYSCI